MSKSSLILAVVLIFAHLNNLSGIDLRLVEENRLSRVSEPVTCGVPLARGYCYSPDELVLKIGGQPVPVEIREVSRWPDGSLHDWPGRGCASRCAIRSAGSRSSGATWAASCSP